MDSQEQESFEEIADEIIEDAEDEQPEADDLIEDGEDEAEADDETEEGGEELPEDVLVVDFAEEEEPDERNNPVRDLRRKLRETERELKELKAKSETPAAQLGEKPTLEGFDYDAEAYEKALLDWNERKKQVDAERAKAEEARAEREKAFNERLETYRENAKALPVKDYADIEDSLAEVLSPQQLGVIIANAQRPELLVYALGKNEKMAADLGKETDLVAFAFKLAQMESKMSVTGKIKPKPESRVSGGTGAPMTGDKKLKQLEEEARRTGDRSKVIAHKRAMKARQAAQK